MTSLNTLRRQRADSSSTGSYRASAALSSQLAAAAAAATTTYEVTRDADAPACCDASTNSTTKDQKNASSAVCE